MKKILFIILFFTVLNTQAQNISGAQAKDDLTFCYNLLTKAHPSLYRYTSKADFDNIYNLSLMQLSKDSVSRLEFAEVLNTFVSAVRCVHTSVSNTVPSKKSKVFDMVFYIHNGHLYARKIKELGNDTTLYRILSIDNLQSEIIINRMTVLRSGDGIGNSFNEAVFAKNFNIYYNTIYGASDVSELRVIAGNVEKTVTVKKVDAVKNSYAEYNWDNEVMIDSTKGAYLYKFKADPSTRILDLKNFSNTYKKFYLSAFDKMKADSVKTLVIDLRGNTGGDIYNAYELLNYLIPHEISFYTHRKKVNIYKELSTKGKFQLFLGRVLYDVVPNTNRWSDSTGWKHYKYSFKPKANPYKFDKLIVLIDGMSVSSSSLVAAYLDYYTDAQFMGIETGGSYRGNNGRAFPEVILPNTGAKLRLPLFYIDYFPGVPDNGRGIIPSVYMDKLLDKESQKKLIINNILAK